MPSTKALWMGVLQGICILYLSGVAYRGERVIFDDRNELEIVLMSMAAYTDVEEGSEIVANLQYPCIHFAAKITASR